MSIKTFCPADEYFKPELTCIKCGETKKAGKFQRENKVKDGIIGHVWRSKCTLCVKKSLPVKKNRSLKERVAALEDSLKEIEKSLG